VKNTTTSGALVPGGGRNLDQLKQEVQQRADRNRAKEQKKQEKRKRLEEETAKRKAARVDAPDPDKTQEDA